MGSRGSKIPIIQKIKKMFVKVENIYMTKLREISVNISLF